MTLNEFRNRFPDEVAARHLGRYASEASHRWNNREIGVIHRLCGMVHNGEGSVLSYAYLTARAA